jgi:S-adenosylmethionine:tRNA ribosyltransferase-isomerase
MTRLAAKGVLVAPVVLHTGVSSLELGEEPYPERFRVPEETARLVNAVHAWGGRVIAVGTTVVRALETVGPTGAVEPREGWTNLRIDAERGLRVVDGLLTGWHEPRASHLELLQAAAGDELLERSYLAALEQGYLWHEFGDSQLLLP